MFNAQLSTYADQSIYTLSAISQDLLFRILMKNKNMIVEKAQHLISNYIIILHTAKKIFHKKVLYLVIEALEFGPLSKVNFRLIKFVSIIILVLKFLILSI
jgi:hypothetical protein